MGERGVLITGAGGFLGRYVLERYLADYPEHTLYLLEHGPFLKKLDDYLKSNCPAAVEDGRIKIFEGDITQPGLGLDAGMRDLLKDRVQGAIHLAALYHLGTPRDVAFTINVEGTRNMLDFCQDISGFERFAHVSTLAVAGTHTGVFDEADFDVGQSFKNYYEETKYLSEKLVRERMPEFPGMIFRPAVVVGHSKTGYIEKLDGPYVLFLAISRHLNFVMPDCGPVKCHIAPVDYVTDGLVALFEKDPDAPGSTFALMDPAPVTYNTFVDRACACWPKTKPLLRLPHRWMEPLARLSIFEMISGIPWEAFQYGRQEIVYTLPETARRLAALGIVCPPLPTYMDVLVKYFQTHLQDETLRRGDWKAILKQ